MKKILLVDDLASTIELYAAFFKAHGGYAIRSASNGQEALEKILEDKPDVVLTDLEMPVMDGYELCKQIRANPKISDVYIIASSGRDLPKGMKDYVDVVFPKGNYIGDLIKKLDSI